MERIINARLIWHLESNKLLADEQFGFRKSRSTEDQVTYLTQCIEDAFDEKKHVHLCLGLISKMHLTKSEQINY